MLVKLLFMVVVLINAPLQGSGQGNDDFAQKRLLMEIISNDIEANPIISSDGRTLYFNRRYHPENFNGKEDVQDVWFSELQANGQWSEPVNLGDIINGPDFDAIYSLSPDGRMAIFHNSQRKKHRPIAISRNLDDYGWERPLPVKIANYYNLNQYADFHHSFIQNVLILAVEREDSQGKQDLYLSFLQENGSYSEPQNLGPVVNTSESDFAPFLGHDNRSLFFASYGHDGMGGSDLYVSYRLDETWMNWTEPVNLGPYINTPGDETYISLTADFEYMYIDSHDPNGKNRNLYQIETPIKFNPFKRPYARRK